MGTGKFISCTEEAIQFLYIPMLKYDLTTPKVINAGRVVVYCEKHLCTKENTSDFHMIEEIGREEYLAFQVVNS